VRDGHNILGLIHHRHSNFKGLRTCPHRTYLNAFVVISGVSNEGENPSKMVWSHNPGQDDDGDLFHDNFGGPNQHLFYPGFDDGLYRDLCLCLCPCHDLFHFLSFCHDRGRLCIAHRLSYYRMKVRHMSPWCGTWVVIVQCKHLALVHEYSFHHFVIALALRLAVLVYQYFSDCMCPVLQASWP
jgi:hypothetical protein